MNRWAVRENSKMLAVGSGLSFIVSAILYYQAFDGRTIGLGLLFFASLFNLMFIIGMITSSVGFLLTSENVSSASETSKDYSDPIERNESEEFKTDTTEERQ